MGEHATKKPRGTGQGDATTSICVAGDQCKCPRGSSSLLIHREKCAPCFKCQAMGHFDCLQTRYNNHYCPPCLAIVRKRKTDQALALIAEKRASLLPNFLEPPPELLPHEGFVRPNISKRMKETLDHELLSRDFFSQDEMAARISAHNAELQQLQDDPTRFASHDRKALQMKDVSVRRLVSEWKKCFRQLRKDYLRNTRCCVKSLRFDSKLHQFHALMEWEESATDVETGEEITVVNY